ncbi:PTS system N-acetylglucosamine-specific IIC component [Cryobacterium sp. MP_M5]|uniref:PTS transporter subunit EIIC n=1 Tax=unclassified Cryobacterium TaxID=2649013 RepID=UPI0018CBE881|nr:MULTISPECIES: PTS transporter subunit EIIC [unclassified Cryobacterium]MBG6058959.1 PTS system N-acetylglucosamine-specific IIC component [Cryobacterium sp. MP_M3]MEC5177032.1 PTS system N-acetylglucosamine-specific IIC component [Cryobacterium sp. MP_M5]
MSSITADAGTKRKFPGLGQAQRVGRSLMLPIAALPAAGLLLRLGQPDLLGGIPGFETGGAVIASAGGALFGALPLLFAVGVAIGFAKKADGSTALAAVVGYLVFSKVGEAMSPLVLGLPAKGGTQDLVNYSVLGGILMGIVSAVLWQKYHRISLPSYLAFFGGRRFVPIITAVVALILGVLLSFVYPAFANGLTGFGEFVTSNNIWGGFLYGTTNRLLIPVGLHHILNSVVWFVIGDYNGATGDLSRFFAGDPTAGSFMTGFFPIMMFALPAGALAIWHEAKPSQKKIVGGIMLSGALTAMLTGVTEPLEFSFMFVAFPLFVIHALLTGSSLALVNALGIRDGFSFSAGTLDYVLNFGLAEKPLLLIPIGLAYAAIYYFLFRFVIRKWNLKTPGRGDDEIQDPAAADSAGTTV